MNFDQSDLPNIPGFRVSVDTRNKFHKSHLFDICNGIPVTDIERNNDFELTPNELENKIISKTQFDDDNNNDNDNDNDDKNKNNNLPKWVIFDKKVLRFYGYFTENVFNSAIEKERVRKVIIYYFLEDDTFMINEIKKENSGITSFLLQRQKIPNNNNNGKWLNYLDIKISSNEPLIIYNRKFYIIDADKATRNYYLNTNNILLNKKIECPKDDYIHYLEKREEFCKLSSSESNDVKSYVEAILGRISSKRLAKSKKYLANDGKVLRFNGIWRDNSFGGTIRKYVILYFLSDDTIQVLEYDQNDKKGEKLIALLKRQKLPKKYIPVGCIVGSNGVAAGNFFKHNDLRIGGYLNIYGRQVLLTSCDQFTKDFYVKVHGLDNIKDFIKIDINNKENNNDDNNKKEIVIPPYNGFGTEEDSLGSWKSLVPKPPVKDHHKLTKYDGCCLRFLAKLNEKKTKIENYQRRFVIEFFLTDDTIKIYEKPLRNSGFISGKFLERTRLKNHAKENSPWFHAEDFYLGATVIINGFTFDLIETDKQTLDIMNNNIEVFTRDSPEQILAALADKLWDRRMNKTATFRFIDEDKDRFISPSEMKSLCAKYGWNVNPNQLKVLFRYFDTDNSGEIEISEFFDSLHKFKLSPHIYPEKQKQQKQQKQ